MKPLDPDTLKRLNRAVLFSFFAFFLFVISSKLGHVSRIYGPISPASWSDIFHNIDKLILASLAVGGLAFFWPATWKP
jgi:hypothetical protein